MATATELSPKPVITATLSTQSEPEPGSIPTPSLYRMSYEVYERIAEQDLLGPKDKVVLLDGLLVKQMTKGPRHGSAVLRGQEALRVAIPAGWHVRLEQAVALKNGPEGDSAPEPDLAAIYGDFARYDERLPEGPEIGLMVEVSSSVDALGIDRAGLPRYAHARIPIVVIVNISDRSIEVYTEPSGPIPDPRYGALTTLRPGQVLAGEIGTALTGPAALAPIPVEAFFAPQ